MRGSRYSRYEFFEMAEPGWDKGGEAGEIRCRWEERQREEEKGRRAENLSLDALYCASPTLPGVGRNPRSNLFLHAQREMSKESNRGESRKEKKKRKGSKGRDQKEGLGRTE